MNQIVASNQTSEIYFSKMEIIVDQPSSVLLSLKVCEFLCAFLAILNFICFKNKGKTAFTKEVIALNA